MQPTHQNPDRIRDAELTRKYQFRVTVCNASATRRSRALKNAGSGVNES